MSDEYNQQQAHISRQSPARFYKITTKGKEKLSKSCVNGKIYTEDKVKEGAK